jgi:hypothetical protein
MMRYRRPRSPRNLPAAPTLKHPEQEEDEGGVPVTFLDDPPLDFRARAYNHRLGVRGGGRSDSARRNHVGGYEQYAHDSGDHGNAEEPQLRASKPSGRATQLLTLT